MKFMPFNSNKCLSALMFALVCLSAFAQVPVEGNATPSDVELNNLKMNIYEVFTTTEPIITDIADMDVNDEEEVAYMIELDNGYSLTLELNLSTTPWNVGSVIKVYTNASAFAALDETGEAYGPTLVQTIDLLTAAEEDTRYFCKRTDGGGGVIAKTLLDVNLDGVAYQVIADVRMDALEQQGQRTIGDKKRWNTDKLVWCISWFSDDCKKDKEGCIPGPCDVTLAALIDLANELGLSIPGNKTIQSLTELLANEAGISVGGDCRPVYFLKIIYVGCQCVLYTFGNPDATTADPVSTQL